MALSTVASTDNIWAPVNIYISMCLTPALLSGTLSLHVAWGVLRDALKIAYIGGVRTPLGLAKGPVSYIPRVKPGPLACQLAEATANHRIY